MMKPIRKVLCVLCCLIPSFSAAEDFLQAPVVPGSETLLKTDSSLTINSKRTHDDAVRYYREALEGEQDIKFRDWKDGTYIEDDGNRPWHSITVSKGDQANATVVILKDSWTWIISTLILRYIGVFAVLMVLFLGMLISGKIISRFIQKLEERKAPPSV